MRYALALCLVLGVTIAKADYLPEPGSGPHRLYGWQEADAMAKAVDCLLLHKLQANTERNYTGWVVYTPAKLGTAEATQASTCLWPEGTGLLQ